jgi:hypothetical protein
MLRFYMGRDEEEGSESFADLARRLRDCDPQTVLIADSERLKWLFTLACGNILVDELSCELPEQCTVMQWSNALHSSLHTDEARHRATQLFHEVKERFSVRRTPSIFAILRVAHSIVEHRARSTT